MASAKPIAELELVNLALLELQNEGVTSLQDETSPVAEAALRQVAPCRRALLRNYSWNFAKTRGVVSRDSTAPLFDFDSRYAFPNDLIRLLMVGGEDERYDPRQYDVQGRYLLLKGEDATVPIIYTRDEDDVSIWDPLFVEVMTLELAVKMCMPVCGDRAIQREIRSRLVEKLAEARAVDRMERPVLVTEYDPVAESRFVGSENPQLVVPTDFQW